MPISFQKYIDITSGVAAAVAVAGANMGGRIFSPNHVFSVDGLYTVTPGTLDDLATLAGDKSEIYLRAVKYFGFISKLTRQAQTLQIGRWQREATPAMIFGASNVSTLTALQEITAGVIKFLFGGVEVDVSAIDFSTAVSLTQVASILQTALNANANANLETATVTWDSVMGRFEFAASSSETAYETISIKSVGGGVTDVALALGWDTTQFPQFVSASPIVSPASTASNSYAQNNNMAGFLFTAEGGTGITQSDAVALATWNKTLNVLQKFHVGVDDTTYAAWGAALQSIGGTCGIYSPDSLASEYHDMQDMIINAATDPAQRNGMGGYMYNEFSNQTPAVTTDALSTALDNLQINYYGQTQVNGEDLEFYQDGVMMGIATDPVDSNVFANEVWLKKYAMGSFMSLQLNQAQVGANTAGLGLLRGKLTKDVIPAAKFNGTISVGKPLNEDQILFITEATGDDNAWQQVQNIGYWYDLTLSSYSGPGGTTRWQANYTLIYSKDDLVRKVVGTHTLI